MFYGFKTVSSTYIFMRQYKMYNHSLSLDATIMVSKNCSITVLKNLYIGFRAAFSCILLHVCLLKFENIKNTVLFLNYKPLKLQLRVFLAGHTVAVVTYCVTKMITCSPIIDSFLIP